MMMMSVITIMIIEQNNSNNVNITTSETIHCKINMGKYTYWIC